MDAFNHPHNSSPAPFRNQRGATMLEYVIMIALIAISCIQSISSVGEEARKTFVIIEDRIASSGLIAPTP